MGSDLLHTLPPMIRKIEWCDFYLHSPSRSQVFNRNDSSSLNKPRSLLQIPAANEGVRNRALFPCFGVSTCRVVVVAAIWHSHFIRSFSSLLVKSDGLVLCRWLEWIVQHWNGLMCWWWRWDVIPMELSVEYGAHRRIKMMMQSSLEWLDSAKKGKNGSTEGTHLLNHAKVIFKTVWNCPLGNLQIRVDVVLLHLLQ